MPIQIRSVPRNCLSVYSLGAVPIMGVDIEK